MEQVLLVFLVYWGIQTLSIYVRSAYVAEPMVYAFFVGIVMGDIQTGLMMGAALQAIFLGVVVVGGVRPTDAPVGTVVATYFAIKTGCDLDTALALAYPIGVLGISFYNLFYSVKYLAIPWMENIVIKEKNMKKYSVVMHIWASFLHFGPKYLIVFLALWLGTDAVQAALDIVPPWVLTGFSASGRMLTAVGMGITLSLLWNKELGGFFFIGFLLFQVVGMTLTQVTVMALSMAVIYFFIDHKISVSQAQRLIENNNSEGDVFDL